MTQGSRPPLLRRLCPQLSAAAWFSLSLPSLPQFPALPPGFLLTPLALPSQALSTWLLNLSVLCWWVCVLPFCLLVASSQEAKVLVEPAMGRVPMWTAVQSGLEAVPVNWLGALGLVLGSGCMPCTWRQVTSPVLWGMQPVLWQHPTIGATTSGHPQRTPLPRFSHTARWDPPHPSPCGFWGCSDSLIYSLW